MALRAICWMKPARKAFEDFPAGVRLAAARAFREIENGGKPAHAKPMHGMGSGVFEIALRQRGDAWRIIYAVQIGEDIWIIHAFQKKSTSGIATPQAEIETIRERLKRLRQLIGTAS